MKVDVYEPLAEFAGKEDSWLWIQDYAEDEEYEELDDILRFLNGEIKRNELPESVRSMDAEELRKEYARRFPVMLGKVLQIIGKELETGELKMEIDFTSLQELAD